MSREYRDLLVKGAQEREEKARGLIPHGGSGRMRVHVTRQLDRNAQHSLRATSQSAFRHLDKRKSKLKRTLNSLQIRRHDGDLLVSNPGKSKIRWSGNSVFAIGRRGRYF